MKTFAAPAAQTPVALWPGMSSELNKATVGSTAKQAGGVCSRRPANSLSSDARISSGVEGHASNSNSKARFGPHKIADAVAASRATSRNQARPADFTLSAERQRKSLSLHNRKSPRLPTLGAHSFFAELARE